MALSYRLGYVCCTRHQSRRTYVTVTVLAVSLLQSKFFSFPSYIRTLSSQQSVTVTHLMIAVGAVTTVDAIWKNVKVLCAYNRTVHIYHLAEYMFGALCRARPLDLFIVFMHTARSVDWTQHHVHHQEYPPPQSTVSTSSLCLLRPQLPH